MVEANGVGRRFLAVGGIEDAIAFEAAGCFEPFGGQDGLTVQERAVGFEVQYP